MKQVYGLINLSLVPLRTDPSDRSEMASQLLFGDCLQILEIREPWVHVRTSFDDYEGWIDSKQYVEIDANTFAAFNDFKFIFGPSRQHLITNIDTQEIVYVLIGSTLPEVKDGKFQINQVPYQLTSPITRPDPKKFASDLIPMTNFYLNAPYLWGGRSPFGIDCSGFTQIIFKQFGFRLKRNAVQQVEQGILVPSLEESQLGDLAFFSNQQGQITHVGILLSPTRIIHASGRVKIDLIDHEGIFNEALSSYTHRLAMIKRISNN